MKNIKSIFQDEQIKMLNEIGVSLSDDKDYSYVELDDIYDSITEHYQVAAFDENSEPKPIAAAWENIIDLFFDKTNR